MALGSLLSLWCAGVSEAQIPGCDGTPVSGSITLSDPTQTSRLFRDGVPDTCAAPGTCGTPIAGTFHYRLHTFQNYAATTTCVTVTVNTACTGTNFVYAGAYIGGFNPAAICTNNVASIGGSPNPTASMSFNVPGSTTFQIVVAEVTANAGCAAYTLTLTGCPASGVDLTILKTHAGSFYQGQTGATYTLTVSNIGGPPSSGSVAVTDTAPAGLTATAISGTGWNCTQPSGPCSRSDSLGAGASYPVLTLTVNVAAGAPASVVNTANVAGGSDANGLNNSSSDTTTVLPGPDLTIAKAHVGSFFQGQTGATYTITVNNAGGSPTVGTTTVTDTVPSGLAATAISGTGWNCTQPSGPCSRADALAAAASFPPLTLTVDVAAGAPASVTNTAGVSGGGDINGVNNSASDPTTVTPPHYSYYTVTPCRVLDTRNPTGPFGGPPLAPSASRTYALAGQCGVPSNASAVSANITITSPEQPGYLTLYPADKPQPLASSINFSTGQTRANNVVLQISSDGTGSFVVFTGSLGTVDFILDVTGFFR